MTWSKHISREHKVPFWYNSVTSESVWEQPADFIEQKEEKKVTATKPKNIVKTEEQKPRQYHESNSNYRQISNGNGQSYNIEGGEHWTKQDYEEELRNINQAFREY